MAPKPSTRPRPAAQPNAAEKKVPCGTCNHDSWIFAHRWIPGRTIRFCCHPFPKPVLEHSLLAKRAAVDSGTVTAGRIEPWLREVLKESRMPLNALATTVPVRKSEPYAQTSSRPVKAKEALTCGSRSRRRCKSCSNSRCNWSMQRYDTSARQSKRREQLKLGSPYPNYRGRSMYYWYSLTGCPFGVLIKVNLLPISSSPRFISGIPVTGFRWEANQIRSTAIT